MIYGLMNAMANKTKTEGRNKNETVDVASTYNIFVWKIGKTRIIDFLRNSRRRQKPSQRSRIVSKPSIASRVAFDAHERAPSATLRNSEQYLHLERDMLLRFSKAASVSFGTRTVGAAVDGRVLDVIILCTRHTTREIIAFEQIANRFYFPFHWRHRAGFTNGWFMCPSPAPRRPCRFIVVCFFFHLDAKRENPTPAPYLIVCT